MAQSLVGCGSWVVSKSHIRKDKFDFSIQNVRVSACHCSLKALQTEAELIMSVLEKCMSTYVKHNRSI